MMDRMMLAGWDNWGQMQQMMQSSRGSTGVWWGLSSFLGTVTWLLVVALLVAAIRYLWIKGSKK